VGGSPFRCYHASWSIAFDSYGMCLDSGRSQWVPPFSLSGEYYGQWAVFFGKSVLRIPVASRRLENCSPEGRTLEF